MSISADDLRDLALHPEHAPGRNGHEATTTDDDSTRRARITWASEIVPEPVVWAWVDDGQGRMPTGTLVLGAGREGTGKSSFAIWQAAQITNGTLPGDFCGTPRRVLYVAVEDSWSKTIVPRLIAAGARLDMIGHFDVVVAGDRELMLTLPHDNELLGKTIIEHDVAAVYVDPLLSAIGSTINTHHERDTRTALDPLSRIADETGAVIFGIAHFNKSNASDAISLITGTGAFKNVARAVFAFARDEPEDVRVITQVKNSLGREGLPSHAYAIESAEIPTPTGIAVTGRFRFLGLSERSVEDVLKDSRGDGDEGERDAAVAWLLAYMDDRAEVPAATVLRDAVKDGFSTRTMQRARSKAKVESRKAAFGSGWVWSAPSRFADPPEDDNRSKADTPSKGEGATKKPKVPSLRDLAPSAPSVASSGGTGSVDDLGAWCSDPVPDESAENP